MLKLSFRLRGFNKEKVRVWQLARDPRECKWKWGWIWEQNWPTIQCEKEKRELGSVGSGCTLTSQLSSSPFNVLHKIKGEKLKDTASQPRVVPTVARLLLLLSKSFCFCVSLFQTYILNHLNVSCDLYIGAFALIIVKIFLFSCFTFTNSYSKPP